MPAREQKIIRYHYFHRPGFEHIADMLDLPKGRVSQLHRTALDEPRRQIGADDFQAAVEQVLHRQFGDALATIRRFSPSPVG